MSLFFFDGFEAATPDPNWIFVGGQLVPLAMNVAGGRFGKCMTSSSSFGNRCLVFTPVTKLTAGFALYNASLGYLSGTNSSVEVMADNHTATHLSLTWDGLGHLQLRRGTPSGTILATSTQSFIADIWTYVEVQATIDDAAGTCKVRVNGVEWLSYVGDTKSGGTSTNIDAIKFVMPGSGSSVRLDDFYACDGVDDTATTGHPDNDFLGDCKVEALYPNGDGAASQWTPSTGTSHFALVDEPTANTSDYVSSSTSGQQDLWTLGDLATVTGTVYAIRSELYAAKSDAGVCSIKTLVRGSGGTLVTGAVQPLSVTYTGYETGVQKTKPGGGSWSIAEVNGLQLGVELA